jgi:phage terminase small subunit
MTANIRAADDNPTAPPAHLTAETQALWQTLVRSLASHQYRTLQLACECWDEYRRAHEVIRVQGQSYDFKGRWLRRPEVNIARDALNAYLRCMRELKLDAPPPKEKIDRNAHLGISWRQLAERRGG